MHVMCRAGVMWSGKSSEARRASEAPYGSGDGVMRPMSVTLRSGTQTVHTLQTNQRGTRMERVVEEKALEYEYQRAVGLVMIV